MFNLFKKSNSSKVPKKILVSRMEEYHTHYLGKTQDERLFFGSVTFAYKKPSFEVSPELQSEDRIELAILFIFDKNGKYIENTYWSTNDENERYSVYEKLVGLISKLGPITYCDVELETFEVTIDGIKCGLIPDEENVSIELYPSNTISFQEPWDGEYYT